VRDLADATLSGVVLRKNSIRTRVVFHFLADTIQGLTVM
jgi:hypothetical protein